MKDISIIGIQLPVVNLNDSLNLLEKTLQEANASHGDVMVFPERWISDIIIKDDEKFSLILDRLLQISRDNNICIVPGSFLIENEGKVTNRSPFILNGKIEGWQEKISPFLNERLKVSGGKEINVFQFNDIKIGIAICYDIDFPYYSRVLALRGCDLIINPALIAENFHDMWHLYVKARSLENRIGIVSVNSSSDIFMGESIASFPFPYKFGAKLSVMTATQTSKLTAKFQWEPLRELRKKRLEDDPGSYELPK